MPTTPTNLTQNCLAWYSFEERTALNPFTNYVPGASGMNGINITTTPSGAIGYALYGTGGANTANNPYAYLPESFIIGAAVTGSGLSISGWFNLQANVPMGRVFDFNQNTGNFFYFAPYNNQGFYTLASYKVGFTSGTFIAATGPSTGVWYHFAAIYDGVSGSLYINGVFLGSFASTHIPNNFTSLDNIWFYRSIFTNDNHFNGYLDEIGVWNRGLTSGEVAGLYNSGSGTTYSAATGTSVSGGLRGWFGFENVYGSRTNSVTSGPAFEDLNSKLPSDPVIHANAFGGSSLYFSGTTTGALHTAYGRILANQISGSAALTFSMWLRPRAQSSNTKIIDIMSASNRYFTIISNNGSSRIQVAMSTALGTPGLSPVLSLTNDIWTHLVVAWSSGSFNMYLNGQLRATTLSSLISPPSSAFTWPTYILVGKNTLDATTPVYQGYLDELSIWNRELTETEIHYLYNSEASYYYSQVTGSTNVHSIEDNTIPLKVINYPFAAAVPVYLNAITTATRCAPLYLTGVRLTMPLGGPIYLSGRIEAAIIEIRRRLWMMNGIRIPIDTDSMVGIMSEYGGILELLPEGGGD